MCQARGATLAIFWIMTLKLPVGWVKSNKLAALVILVLPILFYLAFKALSGSGRTEENLTFIDTHVHILTVSSLLSEIVDKMAEYKVSKMVIMQPPVDLFRYQEPEELGIPEAHDSYPDKFLMLYQSEAIKLLHEVVKKGAYTVGEEDQFKSLAEDAAKSGKYVGFGELALRHFPQPNLTGPQKEARDITIAGDHPWLLGLSDIAAKYNMVLDIHVEPDSNTLPGFEKLISHNTQTKIIFDHASWYNTGQGTPSLFAGLMEKYPNLYSSIKIRKPISSEQSKVAILKQDGKISEDWLAVFEKYPDRFLIGTDVKFGLDSGEGDMEEVYSFTIEFLNALPEDLREKIATKNAQKLFDIE